MSHYQVVALGNALVDAEVQVSDAFLQAEKLQKGQMQLADYDEHVSLKEALARYSQIVDKACGGSAANSLAAFAAFGGSAYLACKVADDEAGRFYASTLQATGIGCQDPVASDIPTGHCHVMVTPDAQRTMQTFLGVSEKLDEQQLNGEAVANANWLYVEGYLASSPSAVQAVTQAIDIAKLNQTKIAVTLSDISMISYFGEQLKGFIAAGVDLIFCNEEEAFAFSQADSLQQAADALLAFSQTVVITRGQRGAKVFVANQNPIHSEAVVVEAIDTNGAGDIFAGAYLYGLEAGWPALACADFANSAAAKLVTQYGPRLTVTQYKQLLENFNAA